ncbi:MAG TPA: ornithine cyclodeaminase family protein [Ignavibacteriaceae bacterium]|nr:ornithine cyclodeaminase family protein [Ignavibacteriaceae bacterium]
MLILNHEEILKSVNFIELIDASEKAMLIHTSGNFKMPVRLHVDYNQNTLLAMPCFTENNFGTKLVSLFPGNSKTGTPVTQGLVILNDGKTGEPLAIMNGATITALRTSAIGSLSIKLLARQGVKNLGVVGAGVQGFYQTLLANTVRNFKNVFINDINTDRVSELSGKLSESLPELKVHSCTSPEEVLKNSDVIITVTNTKTPLFPNNPSLFKEKHFVGIGSYKPDMREYPETFFKELDKIYIDTEHAFEETGDLITPIQKGWIKKEQVVSIADAIQNDCKGVNSGTSFFKSVGMALFDIVIAELIFKKSKEKKLGTTVIL